LSKNSGNILKVAVVRLSAIGDIVFSLIAAALIKQKFSDAKITWIVDERFAAVVEDSPFVDNIIAIKLKPLGLSGIVEASKKLRNLGEFDIALDLQGLFKSAVVTGFLRSSKKVGYSYKSAREPIASFFYTHKCVSDYQKNIVERYIDLLNCAFGGGFLLDDANKKPKLLGYKAQNTKTVQNKKNILINMSASKPNKIYPADKMQEVVAAFENENIIMLDGSVQMELDEIKAVVDSCDLVIGGDTGITHMAWAMNVPSVTIFGATPHERNAFATVKNVMIGAKDGVDAFRLDYDDYSIATIEPSKIVEAAKGLL
jgi:heptosyltransferase-1